MKNLIKLVLMAFLFLILVLPAFSAGSREDKAAKGKVTLRMWSKGSGADPAMNALIASFMEEYPNYEVVYEPYGENYANVVNLALASGDAPDIFENGGNFPIQTLAAQGLIIPVDDVFTNKIKDQMFPSVFTQSDVIYEGQLYSIATRVTTFRLLYNKELFRKAGLNPDQPPTTLEEMRKMAAKITQAGKGEFYGFGLYLGSGNIWERVLDPIAVAESSSAMMGFDFSKGEFDFADNAKILSFLAEIGKDGSLFPGYETLAPDPMRANFAQGNVGMYFDGNWSSGMYATQIKTDIDWATAPIPIFANETYGKGYCAPGVDYVISSASKNQDVAKMFLRYMLTHSDIMQQEKPEPKTFLPANENKSLPIAKLNLKGTEYNFKLDDLAPMPQLVHNFLSLEGDKRDQVFTNLYIKMVRGTNVDLDKEVKILNDRYNSALDKAIKDGLISKSDITLPNYSLKDR